MGRSRFVLARGHWTPPNRGDLLVQVGLAVIAFIRGTDYFSDDSPAAVLDVVTRNLGLEFVGISFMLGALLVALGLWARWGVVAISGHIVLSAAYVSVGLGLLIENGLHSGYRTGSGILLTGALVQIGMILSVAYRSGEQAATREREATTWTP